MFIHAAAYGENDRTSHTYTEWGFRLGIFPFNFSDAFHLCTIQLLYNALYVIWHFWLLFRLNMSCILLIFRTVCNQTAHKNTVTEIRLSLIVGNIIYVMLFGLCRVIQSSVVVDTRKQFSNTHHTISSTSMHARTSINFLVQLCFVFHFGRIFFNHRNVRFESLINIFVFI